MRKIIYFSLCMLLLGACKKKSSPEPAAVNNTVARDEAGRYAENAASKLLQCCTSFGFKDKQVVVFWDDSKLLSNEALKIKMKVNWKGKLSGASYYVQGTLTCDADGCGAYWQTENYSQVPLFDGSCGDKCNLSCVR